MTKNSKTPLKLLTEIFRLPPRGLVQLCFGAKVTIIDDVEVLSLLKDGHSLIRFGDGETALMRGKSIFFQESDQLLAIKLRDILFSRQDRFLLGIPWSVYVGPLNSKWTLQTLKIHLSTRVFWIGIMMHKPKMLSFARGDIFHEKSDCIPDLLSSIERRGNTLVVIGNSRVLSSLPIESDKIIKIEVMEKNAFKQINDVSSQIENLLRLYGDSLTLCLAAGPAGKVLGFRFSGRCQILDLGHGFDFIRDGKWAWVWNEHE